MTSGSPDLSFVLVTDCAATVRYTLAHLRAQEGRERIELLLVTGRDSDIGSETPVPDGF